MIEVELPDGSIAEFPDNTSDEVIQGVLQRQFGAPQPKPGWTPASEADVIERFTGTSGYSDASGSGMAGSIPFLDEMGSAVVGAPIRAARDWWNGDGFDYGRAYDREQQLQAELQRRRDERSPIASTVGKVAGGIAASAPLAAGGLSFLNGAKPTALSMAGRGAAEGGAYGLAYGLGEGDGLLERLYNGTVGTVAGGATGGLFGLLGRAMAGRQRSTALPTADDLRAASQAAYQQADDAGVAYSQDAVRRIRDQLVQDFAEFGYHPELQSGAKVALNEISRIADADMPVTLKGLDTARKLAGNAFQPGNKANNALTGRVTSAIDDLVANPQTGDIVAGDGTVAAEAIRKARELYRQASKLETVNTLTDRAGRRAAASGSGGNVENATRQELNKILNSDRMQRGFTPQELEAVRKAVVGSPGQDLLRLAGKMSPEGNGLSLMLHLLGGSATGGATIPLAAIGMAAKRGSDAMASNAARMAEAIIASGGTLPEQALSPITKAIVEALAGSSGRQLPGYISP